MAERRKNRKRKDVSVAYGRKIVRRDRPALNATRTHRARSLSICRFAKRVIADPSDVDRSRQILPTILPFRVTEHEFTDDREFTAHTFPLVFVRFQADARPCVLSLLKFFS